MKSWPYANSSWQMLCARWVLWLCTGSTWPSCFGKHFNWSVWASVSLRTVKTSCLPHFLLLRLLPAFSMPSWYAARCSAGLPHACSVWVHTVPLCRQKHFALGYKVVHDCSLHLRWLRRTRQRLSSVEITAWCKPICSSKFVQLWGFFFFFLLVGVPVEAFLKENSGSFLLGRKSTH